LDFSDGNQLKYNLVNAFQVPTRAKSLVSAVYYNLDDSATTVDIKKSVTFVNEKKTLAVDTSI